VTVTFIPDGIILLAKLPGTVPPHVAGSFQSPFLTAVTVTSLSGNDLLEANLCKVGINDMAGNFGINDMAGRGVSLNFGRIGRCGRVGIVEFAKPDFVIPVADPVSADTKLNEFEIVPTSNITIRIEDANPILLCTYLTSISILIS
jgi:hypothetical protein